MLFSCSIGLAVSLGALVSFTSAGALKLGTAGTLDEGCVHDLIQKVQRGKTAIEADCVIGDEGAKKLSKALASSRTVVYVKLRFSKIGGEGAEALGKVLARNEHIERFYLENSIIGDRGAVALGQALATNEHIKRMSLSDNRIGNVGATALGRALQNNTHLESIDLHSNRVRSTGVKAFGEALESNVNLKTLRLDYNLIGSEGAKALGKALQKNAHLESLDLHLNTILDEGAEAFGEALESNMNLKTLRLDSNSIGDEGAKALGRALQNNKHLESIDLRRNRVGDGGAQAFGKALKGNVNLKILRLEYNHIGDEGAKALSALAHNEHIEKIRLSRNRIGVTGAKALANASVEALKDGQTPPLISVGGKFQAAVFGYMRDYIKDEERYIKDIKHKATLIIGLTVSLSLVAFIIVAAWHRWAVLKRHYAQLQIRYFPERTFIPGISDIAESTRWPESIEMTTNSAASWLTAARRPVAENRKSLMSSNTEKFEVGRLILGRAQLAAGGIADFIKASSDTMRKRFGDTLLAIRQEWENLDETTYAEYCTMPMLSKAQALEFTHYIFDEAAQEKEDPSNAGDGQFVTRDKGRAGMTLAQFANTWQAVQAGLQEAHCAAGRIYSTALFQVINKPFREPQNLNGFQEEHPTPVTVLVLQEMLKKTRQLHTGESSGYFWRGMKNLHVAGDFLTHGGTELGPMSTSTSIVKVGEYCQSEHPLILKVVCDSFMERGSDISWLSFYPGEKEVLYPPLTYLEPVKTTLIKNHKGTVLHVRPHIS